MLRMEPLFTDFSPFERNLYILKVRGQYFVGEDLLHFFTLPNNVFRYTLDQHNVLKNVVFS